MATSFPRKNSRQDLDRFIPNRNAMDFDYAGYMLMEARRGKANHQSDYTMQLAQVLKLNRTRILAFRKNPPIHDQVDCVGGRAIRKRGRYIPQKPERCFDAPDFVDDYYLNLLDWGSGNVLAIALGNTVHLWNASNGDVSQLVTVDEEICPVTSVKWASDGRHIALGFNNSEVQIWDSRAYKHLNTLRGCHSSRVGALEWNDQILTTGGMDAQIVNSDVRMRGHIVQTYRGHNAEVCGLRWSASGKHLASGGNDHLVHIWDRSMASSNSPTQWLHRLQDHTAAVKALAWCPFNENLLASGGGEGDRCIKFWNTCTAACLNSTDTGSQVCSLLWNKNERELLSSHGYAQYQLTLWKYPSMVKIIELTEHTSRVLHMSQSPDGCSVASAAADETLKIWNIFGDPEVAKRTPKAVKEPFANFNLIR